MAYAQTQKLQEHYDGLDISEKKQFIEDLREQLIEKDDSEYTKFLNKCIREYNAEILNEQ